MSTQRRLEGDALVVVTDWNEFKQLDLQQVRNRMRRPVIVDGRNIYDPEIMKRLGFAYRGFGRGYNGDQERKRVEKKSSEK